jgi:SHS2 domain-containing protein
MGHRFVEHVGEVEIDLDASSEAEIFASALAAFAELVASDGAGGEERRNVELSASDHALLLVDWLSELVYLAEVDGFVPVRVEALELDGDRLRAAVAGRRGELRHLVKAVTLHGLELREEGGAWHGRVVLDV